MSDENRGLERTLMNTDDAMVWAKEFCRIFTGKVIGHDVGEDHNEFVDEGTMVGWFANAMQVAVDMYERRKLRDKELHQARETAATRDVPEAAREAFVEGAEDGRGET